jgi:HEAT repeat protein
MGMRRRLSLLIFALAAAACHRDEPMAGGKPLSYWKKEATKVSLFSFWNSDKNYRRREAFRRLSEIGEPAVPALLDLFRKPGISVSGDAFNALANLGPRAAGAVPELVKMVNGEKNVERRRRAAWILGTIGPGARAAVPTLTPLLQHPDPRMREVVARSLAQIGGSGHVALENARESSDVRKREAAVGGMAAARLDPASRRDLVASALADRNPEVRKRGVELLMLVKREEAEALAEYLVKALNDSAPQVNMAAHAALTMYLQQQVATTGLLAVVLKGGDAGSRADAAWHLGHRLRDAHYYGPPLNEPAVTEALVGALNDAQPKVRIYAGRALAYAEGDAKQRAIRTLRTEMPKAEPILGVRAARVLWEVAHNVAEVKPVYEAGLADADRWNRVETISAIADMEKDAETFVPDLERLLTDPTPEVRDRAEKILYAIRRRSAR